MHCLLLSSFYIQGLRVEEREGGVHVYLRTEHPLLLPRVLASTVSPSSQVKSPASFRTLLVLGVRVRDSRARAGRARAVGCWRI